jgi:ferredoxin
MDARLRVNPIACEAHGLCAELFPERITLDHWGYPIIADEPIPHHLAEHAARAVGACPTLALLLEVETASPAQGQKEAAEGHRGMDAEPTETPLQARITPDPAAGKTS